MDVRSAIVLALWIIFFVTFVRAAIKGKLVYPAGRRIWMMFFLSILAFSFWGESAEASLDQHFYNWPIALYLKYVCLIWVCHLYLQMLSDVGGRAPKRTFLNFLAPAAIGVGVLSAVVYAVAKPMPIADLRFIIIGARDAVVLLFVLFGFLADTLAMWQQEQVQAMRVKQAAIMAYLSLFAVTAIGSISAAMMTIFQFGDAAYAAQVLQPFIYPAVLLFIFTLIPYRWYASLLHLPRLLTYYRLKRVEYLVVNLAGTQPDRHTLPGVVARPGELELAIYRTVISILDCYPMIKENDEERWVFSAIHRCVQNNPDYPDLVGALAAVRR